MSSTRARPRGAPAFLLDDLPDSATGEHLPGKRLQIFLLALAELLAIGVWFSGSAVAPQLTEELGLTTAAASWLTMSVQLGFVAGALLSAATNLADRISAERLFTVSALAAATANGAIALGADSTLSILSLRFLTGVALAGIYPPAMKLAASWTRADRGLGIGILIAALVFGKALPHLFNSLAIFGGGGMPPWRVTLSISSFTALIAAVIAAKWIRPGPHLGAASAFDVRYALRALTDRPTRLANFGYLGHMWELYAMWVWVPILLLTAYESVGWSVAAARLAGFGSIACGALGSVLAGRLADRWGRSTVTIWALVISGVCCLTVGLLFESPGLLTVVCMIWGFAVVADSAQFSAAVSELADVRFVGTALTVQTSLGFLLTLLTIRLVPEAVELVGWRWGFAPLALGPLFGIWSMWRLRGLPEAVRMAGGNR